MREHATKFLRWLGDGDNLLKLWTFIAALLTVALELVMVTVWKGGVDFTFGTLVAYVVFTPLLFVALWVGLCLPFIALWVAITWLVDLVRKQP